MKNNIMTISRKTIALAFIAFFLFVTNKTFSQCTSTVNTGGNCVSNDFVFQKYYIGDANGVALTGVCQSGTPINAFIWMQVTNSSTRYSLQVSYDFVVTDPNTNISTTTHIDNCLYNLQAIPNSLIKLGPVNWTCGDVMTIKNFLMGWQNNVTNPCGAWSAASPKCRCMPDAIVNAPLSVNYIYGACNNGATTTVSFASTATGGSTPYVYSWNFGNGTTSSAANPTVTFNNPGPYTVTLTVTGADNSVGQNTESVTFPNQLTATTSVTNVTVAGANNGSATVTPSGGTSPYTYSWNTSPSQTGQTAINLVAGSYTVLVTDANGCTTTKTVTVSEPQPLSGGLELKSDVNCFGAATGFININVTGGTSPYTYSWTKNGSSFASTKNISGLTAGVYQVTITDANGAVYVVPSITILQPAAPLAATASVTSNVLCNAGTTGSATVGVTGGTTNYTYSWSNGVLTSNNNNIAAGSYSVLVTDSKGCTSTSNVTITEPATALSANVTAISPVSCTGGVNGSESVTATGGTSPYTYSWSNNTFLQTASNLPAGTYTVVVTDNNGCTTSASGTVTEPAASVTSAITVSSHVSCNGGTNGTALVNAAGGNGGFIYSWSNTETTQNITGLIAGTYSVLVTDSKGCTATASTSVTEPPVLVINSIEPSDYNGANITCFAMVTGYINLDVTGGSGTYTYSWNNGASTQNVSNIGAGSYSVTVSDANGCTVAGNADLTQPSLIEYSIDAAVNAGNYNITCNGISDGSATISVSGGIPAYTYSWSNGATDATATGLAAGTHTVVIEDSNGCSDTGTVTLIEPQIFTMSASVTSNYNGTQISCNGNSDASASATITNGVAPVTYAWTDGGAYNANTATITGLAPGTYSVTVTDVNGCTAADQVVITEPTVLTSTINATETNGYEITCYGDANGSASVAPVGGSGTYTYDWSNGSTTNSATGLTAGNYSVTISDANGCSVVKTISITQPDILTSVANISSNYNGFDVTCAGQADGSINLTIAGGEGTNSYLWSNGATTEDLANVAAGTYSVTVTDGNGCTATASIVVTDPETVTAQALATSNYGGYNVTCDGLGNGTAGVSVDGGTHTFTYAWLPGGQTTQAITGLYAGTYTVTITDDNGCSATSSVILTGPSDLDADATITSNYNGTNISCYGASDASVGLSVTGGAGAVTYSWSNGATTQTLTNVTVGTYSVVVTDANNCAAAAAVEVTQPTQIGAGTVMAAVYNNYDVSCFGATDGAVNADASGGYGTYTYSWSNGATTELVTGLGAGNYTVTVTDTNGCVASATVALTQPPLLDISASVLDPKNGYGVSCFGSSDGSASTSVNGGVSAYSYSWSNGSTTATISNLAAGTYTVYILDNNNCSDSATVTINQPAALDGGADVSTNYNGYGISCYGSMDANATATITNGVPTYTYSWSNGASTANISNLAVGNYSVTITDANGCSLVDSITVNAPPALGDSIALSNFGGWQIRCRGQANGTISVGVTGGTPVYSYSWSNGSTAQNLTDLVAGTYTLVVTDDNGCTISDTITLNQPDDIAPGLVATTNFNGKPVSCQDQTDGIAQVTPIGGTSPYTYSWSANAGGATTQSVSNLGVGTYTVSVTDANSCTAASSITLTANPLPNVDAGQAVAVCSGTNVTLTATNAQTYTWMPGTTSGSSINITPTADVVYYVTGTDANGCVNTDSVAVNVYDLPSLTLSYDNEICVGESTTLTASSNGNGATYTWSPVAQTGSTITVSPTSDASYTVQVTDVNNCSSSAQVANVTVHQLPTVAIDKGATYDLCLGNNVTLSAVATGANTYSWSTGSTATSINVTPSTDATYTVSVSSQYGCVSATSIAIDVHDMPVAAIANAGTICYGNNIVLQGSGAGNYQWSNGATTSSITVSPTSLTSYILIVSNADGCSDTAYANVIVNPTPVADFTADSIRVFAGTDIHFLDSSYANITNWSWDFADGNSSNAQNPTHAYTNLGTYTVLLTVTNQFGCADTHSLAIEVVPGIVIPNVFTPNGDGINDEFSVLVSGAEEFKLEIYDRWGILMYSTVGTNGIWDGMTRSGRPATDGTYYYIVTIRHTPTSERQVLNGFLQLIR